VVVTTAISRRVVGRAIRAGELGHVLDDVRLGFALNVLVYLEVLQVAAVFQLLVEHCVRQLHNNTAESVSQRRTTSQSRSCL